MEWFQSLSQNLKLDQFIQNSHWMDWVLLFAVALGVIYGAVKGLWREAAKSLELLLLTLLVMELYPKVTYFLNTSAKLQLNFATPVAYLITVALGSLMMIFIDGYLRKTMHTTVVPAIRITGGAFFGFINAVLVIGLLSQAIFLWPIPSVKRIFQEGATYFCHKALNVAPKAHEAARAPFEWANQSKKSSSS